MTEIGNSNSRRNNRERVGSWTSSKNDSMDGGSGADGVIDHAHEIAFGDWTVEAENEAPDTDLEALATLFDFNNDGGPVI